MPVSSQEPSCVYVPTPRRQGRVTAKPPPRPSAVESIPVVSFLLPRSLFQRAVTEKFQRCAVRTVARCGGTVIPAWWRLRTAPSFGLGVHICVRHFGSDRKPCRGSARMAPRTSGPSATWMNMDESSAWTYRKFTSTIRNNERSSYGGSIEASQASDVGSIPIARSIVRP